MFKDIHIETPRLLIRPFTMSDLTHIHSILSQAEVMAYLPEGVMSLEGVRDTLAWIIDCYNKNTPQQIIKFTVAVTEKTTGRLIGWVGLGPLAFEPGRVELCYGMDKAVWGRGLATEAAGAMLDYGFGRLRLPEIVAVVHPDNTASVRVIEKLGFRYEKTVCGMAPEHQYYEGDRYYSLTRQEYQRAPRSKDAPDDSCQNLGKM